MKKIITVFTLALLLGSFLSVSAGATSKVDPRNKITKTDCTWQYAVGNVYYDFYPEQLPDGSYEQGELISYVVGTDGLHHPIQDPIVAQEGSHGFSVRPISCSGDVIVEYWVEGTLVDTARL